MVLPTNMTLQLMFVLCYVIALQALVGPKEVEMGVDQVLVHG